MQGPAENKRAVAVWHRRAGKDLMAINIISTKVPERVGMYWHMLPTYKQGRGIVWNGHTRDGRAFLDHFHPDLVTSKNSTEMRITFTNGAHYQVVGTDNIDSLVGTNPVGVVFSEYSLQDPGAWDYIRPILAENGGWALFIYTARGRNHGFHMYEMAKTNKRWFSERLTAGSGPQDTKRPDGTPVISDETIQEERKSGMPEEMIEQEFKCSFEAPFVGAYYGSQMISAEKEGRLMENIPHEPRLTVDTYWDLGINDTTCIWFVQHYGGEERIIDYYEMSGEGLPHFAKVLGGQVDNYGRMGSYTYGKHYAPHDIKVRELGTGKSREETAKSLGIRFQMVKKHTVEDGIEAVRSTIPVCWFSRKTCQRGIDGLSAYRKAWDDKNKIFQNHPLHDWASNPSDAFRYFAMGRKDRPKNARSLQQTAVDEYQYL
jgi:phage terminase large subunit